MPPEQWNDRVLPEASVRLASCAIADCRPQVLRHGLEHARGDPSRPGEQLPQIMGRAALPALEFCRKFARERASPERELDLILFLDAEPAQRAAREADVQAFCDSADPPRGFNE